MINVQVKANKNESSLSLLRRFSKKVKSAGIIPAAKSNRFRDREMTDFKKKKNKLRLLKKREQKEKLFKLGLLPKRKRSRF